MLTVAVKVTVIEQLHMIQQPRPILEGGAPMNDDYAQQHNICSFMEYLLLPR